MNDITLIHLVSQQTMQNLLPVIALRPRRVVQVLSSDSRFPAVANGLEVAIARIGNQAPFRGFRPECERLEILNDSPGIEETSRTLHAVADQYPNCAINFTGGTKPMSIAAWQVAAGRDKPAVYCDTQMRRLVCTSHPQLSGLLTFDQLVASLTVDTVMAAHGATGRLHDGMLTPERCAFGRLAFGLRVASPTEFDQYRSDLEAHFYAGKRKMTSSRAHLQHLVADPLPLSSSPPVASFMAAAATAGFLSSAAGSVYRPNCGAEYAGLDRLATILVGGWLELYVADLLTANRDRFTDVRWSVEAPETALGETDVVAVDRANAALHLVSCKSTVFGVKPLEHLEALSQRRRDMGGAFAKATLAVFCDPARQAPQIKRWGRLLDVDVVFGAEIATHLGASPSATGPA